MSLRIFITKDYSLQSNGQKKVPKVHLLIDRAFNFNNIASNQ